MGHPDLYYDISKSITYGFIRTLKWVHPYAYFIFKDPNSENFFVLAQPGTSSLVSKGSTIAADLGATPQVTDLSKSNYYEVSEFKQQCFNVPKLVTSLDSFNVARFHFANPHLKQMLLNVLLWRCKTNQHMLDGDSFESDTTNITTFENLREKIDQEHPLYHLNDSVLWKPSEICDPSTHELLKPLYYINNNTDFRNVEFYFYPQHHTEILSPHTFIKSLLLWAEVMFNHLCTICLTFLFLCRGVIFFNLLKRYYS